MEEANGPGSPGAIRSTDYRRSWEVTQYHAALGARLACVRWPLR
jgi:hypothetical protein